MAEDVAAAGKGGEGGKEESKRTDRSISDTLNAVSEALSARGGGGSEARNA